MKRNFVFFVFVIFRCNFYLSVFCVPAKSKSSSGVQKFSEEKFAKPSERKSVQPQDPSVPDAVPTWTWQVAVNTLQDGDYRFRCGGSLIDTDVVLTAAHCLRNPDVTVDMVQVVAGDFDRNVTEATEQVRDVLKLSVHSNYTGTLSSLYSNDIALLKLSTPVSTASESVSLIPLASADTSTSSCVITGWAISYTKSGTNGVGSKLSSADVVVLSNDECNKRKYWDSLIKPSQLCAHNKQISACLGDSGGPLVCLTNNRYVQYGVTSWGSKSCDRKPSVFTRLSHYLTWIKDTVSAFNS